MNRDDGGKTRDDVKNASDAQPSEPTASSPNASSNFSNPNHTPQSGQHTHGPQKRQSPSQIAAQVRGEHSGGRAPVRRAPSTKPSASPLIRQRRSGAEPKFAALDLGTNNCRLLIVSRRGKSMRVIDAFSRIVRLGEGVSKRKMLSAAAMRRTIDALEICADKVRRRGVTHIRCVATQACREAGNGAEFLQDVFRRTGLTLEIITPEEEARLAVMGCADLIDEQAPVGLVFDIGGGSTELSWVRPGPDAQKPEVLAWTSMPFGVVSMAEKFGGKEFTHHHYESIVADAQSAVRAVGDPANMRAQFDDSSPAHLLGTSGTVTSIAGVHLGLARYSRDAVDGLWLSDQEARCVAGRLRDMSFEARASQPCIGKDRADLVVGGCAILEALMREWPSTRIRVADRGLREGVLVGLMNAERRSRRKGRR